MTTITETADEMLEDLAAELEIPESRYDAAERSYRSVGEWLERPQSALAKFKPRIYPQGSFRLGTATKPASDGEHYDLDVVCELSMTKEDVTQQQLKEMLGGEIEAYAERRGMAEPGESRRCWTLEYADGAQFHMDLLPALPDGARQRLQLESRGFDTTWAKTAIAITDWDHSGFRERRDDWPSSNPKGYSKWFVDQMRVLFEERRIALASRVRAKAEDIPDYRVKTPLQQAVQILKRHRDVTFRDRQDDRPISVILTTLAARSYRQEPTISGALLSILEGMDRHIEKRKGVYWVPNPTDQRENFADRWAAFPERREAFYEWLSLAQQDFGAASAAVGAKEVVDALSARMGRRLVEAAVERQAARHVGPKPSKGIMSRLGGALVGPSRRVLDASHRQAPHWPEHEIGSVRIEKAICVMKGFRPRAFGSDGAALPKGTELTFEAVTTVRRPYKVFWQITNTGQDAASERGGLRGGFDEGVVVRGKLSHCEGTRYFGTHGIECFIVKEGTLVARSGIFVVNIL